MGEAAVTNANGICHVLAINTTEKDLSIEIPPQELIPFEYYNLPGEDSDEYFLAENFKCERGKIEEVIDKLQLDHLNQEEKEHVIEIVREFPGSFYLPGKPLTSTHLVQHKIHITDEIPINTRPYRFSPAQKEEIERVITKMKTEGAIQNSKSRYNSP